MNATTLLALSLLLQAGLNAQHEAESSAIAAKIALQKRLTTALGTTAATSDTAFAIEWAPDKKNQPNNPWGQIMGDSASGKVTGSWHTSQHHVKFDNNEKDELLFAADRMIARDDNHDWCLRRGHLADGNTIPYVPDAQLLLQQLASWPLAITHREAGALNDRPVEIVAVTLNPEQVGELLWSGCLPPSLATANFANVVRIVMAGNAARTAATPPDTTIDLAIALDPGTNLVHEVRVRAWTKANQNGGVFAFPAGRVQVAGGQQPDEEDEEEDDVEPKNGQEDAPLTYVKGLPKRSRKKTMVHNFKITLREHGQHAAPEWNERQKLLLPETNK
jgi:hypothetical protein